MIQEKPAILWLRQDLRLADNPALQAAANNPFFAVYIWDEQDPWSPGGASRWWLHKSLNALKLSLRERGVQLIFKRGNPLRILKALTQEIKACGVYWNRCYEPYAINRDKEIKSYLTNAGIPCQSFNGSLLAEPWEIQTKTKGPYQVFTPFWKVLQTLSVPKPSPIPDLHGWKTPVSSNAIEEWGFKPTTWGQGLEKAWQPGERGAWERLSRFLEEEIETYASKRDYPSENGTSHLSPYLHWGELSPRQIWHQVSSFHGVETLPFLRQLGWREFSYHLLFHFPELPSKSLRSSFDRFPWEVNTDALKAWQTGKTGYPLVDAGMRELWHTGAMHNRVRMVVASFLVKHLLLPWQKGEEWFWDTLVDADLANNAASWQWVAGCGADAAPYFRIFNPTLQSQKFDLKGTYIKQWVPELKALDSPYIHSPWQAPPEVLEKAGINLGTTYPFPIVDHTFARIRALQALKTLSY
ncbi:MAG TPA: deoxyribodipyrimidine photo-lyase [Alphaproteobacteria bacterium]|nr:deoxyribodipyrimidine photo-lyase [Alphaproteobacteria bacterium]